MTIITKELIAELRAKAETTIDANAVRVAGDYSLDSAYAQALGRHQKASNPQTVLALLDKLENVTTECDYYRAFSDSNKAAYERACEREIKLLDKIAELEIVGKLATALPEVVTGQIKRLQNENDELRRQISGMQFDRAMTDPTRYR